MWGRFRRWPRLRPLLLAIGLAAVALWLTTRGYAVRSVRLAAFSEPATMLRAGPAEVLSVIDGDTLLLRQPATATHPEFTGKVRLLGINSPDSAPQDAPPQPFDAEATRFLQQHTAGKQVLLELDKRRVDRYGRFLAYVYVGNLMLNEELLAAGLARVHTYPGDSMSANRKVRAAQDAAKREERGMWSQQSTGASK